MIRVLRNALKILNQFELNQFEKKQIGYKINDIQVEIYCLPILLNQTQVVACNLAS
jgi:hypothetical protein